jgi:hypothetical protein
VNRQLLEKVDARLSAAEARRADDLPVPGKVERR